MCILWCFGCRRSRFYYCLGNNDRIHSHRLNIWHLDSSLPWIFLSYGSPEGKGIRGLVTHIGFSIYVQVLMKHVFLSRCSLHIWHWQSCGVNSCYFSVFKCLYIKQVLSMLKAETGCSQTTYIPIYLWSWHWEIFFPHYFWLRMGFRRGGIFLAWVHCAL